MRFATHGGYQPRTLWESWGSTYASEPGREETGPEHALLARLLAEVSPDLVLELGCGFGRNLRFILDQPRPPRVAVGIDLAGTMLLRATTYEPRALLAAGDVRAIPVADKAVNLLVTHGVLMHVPPANLDEAMREVARVADVSFHAEEVRSVRRPGASRKINPYTFAHDYRTAVGRIGSEIVNWSIEGPLLRMTLRHSGVVSATPKYHTDASAPRPGDAHDLALRRVPPGSRVLELGCATGYLSRWMREAGSHVVGIELDAASAAVAEQFCERVIVGSLEDPLVWEQAGTGFDVVLAAAVLEHLKDPLDALRRCVAALRPGGSIVVNLPNVAHWQERLLHLRGHFDYEDYGIRDRTHLKFFTYDTARELFTAAGLRIIDFAATRGPVLLPLVALGKLWPRGRTMVEQGRPNLFAHEMIFVLHQ